MHIIIIGAGQVGQHLAKILVDEQQDVYIIERDEKLARELDERLDAQVLHGTGISRETLFRAGINRCDLLLAVTQTDEVNLVAAMTAERINRDCRTVARVRDTRFLYGSDALRADEYGVDLLLGPEQAVASQVVAELQYAGPGHITTVAEGKISLLELPVAPHSALAFVSHAELNAELPSKSRLVAVLGKEEMRIPVDDDRFQVGDRLCMLCAPGEVNQILEMVGSEVCHINRVLMIGGDDIGLHVAGDLQRLKFNVTVVEADKERAETIATRIKKCTVINEDGTQPSVLESYVRDGHDAFVILVDDDSSSLLTGITVKEMGARKVIARVDNPDYGPVARKLGVDATISPRRAVADSILRFARRSQITSTTMLGNHQGELIQFQIGKKSLKKWGGAPVGELKLPKNAKVGAVIRGGEVIIPDLKTTELEIGDDVLLVALREAVPKLDELID